jgi:hypothetical protein
MGQWRMDNPEKHNIGYTRQRQTKQKTQQRNLKRYEMKNKIQSKFQHSNQLVQDKVCLFCLLFETNRLHY